MKKYKIKRHIWALLSQGGAYDIGIRRETTTSRKKIGYGEHNHFDLGLYEAFYLLKGRAKLRVDGKTVNLKPSEIFVVEPDETRELVKPPNSSMDVLAITYREVKQRKY